MTKYFFIPLFLCLSGIFNVQAQQRYQFSGAVHIGPKLDIYRITNGSKEFVRTFPTISATAGINTGVLIDNKIMLESGLYNYQLHSSFNVTSRSGDIVSDDISFPTLSMLLIPVKFSVFKPLENDWNMLYGFSAWVMIREEINRNPEIESQILQEDPESGTTDFLQFKVKSNVLTGSNILFSAHFGLEKKLFDQVYMSGEFHLRTAMSYINEYGLDYSSNNDRPRSVIISSRGTSPLLLVGLRFKGPEKYR